MKILLISSNSETTHGLRSIVDEIDVIGNIQYLVNCLQDLQWIKDFDAVIIDANFRLDESLNYRVLGNIVEITKGEDIFRVITQLHPDYEGKIFGTKHLTQKYLDRESILDIDNPQACLDIINERINSINDFSNENFNN